MTNICQVATELTNSNLLDLVGRGTLFFLPVRQSQPVFDDFSMAPGDQVIGDGVAYHLGSKPPASAPTPFEAAKSKQAKIVVLVYHSPTPTTQDDRN